MPSRLLLAMATLSFAIACSTPAADPRGTERDLMAAIAAYDSAWLAKDSVRVAGILASEYTYFTSVGGLSDRLATLAFLGDTGYVLTLSRRTDVRARLVGTTAVISSRWEGAGRYRAERVQDDQTCGQTWVWNGAWLLLSEHCVNRPPGKPETT